MSDLLILVQTAFASDPTTAGVTLAHVPGKGFYGSVCRYLKPMGQGRVVVAKTFAPTIEDVVVALTNQVHDEVRPS